MFCTNPDEAYKSMISLLCVNSIQYMESNGMYWEVMSSGGVCTCTVSYWNDNAEKVVITITKNTFDQAIVDACLEAYYKKHTEITTNGDE